MSRTTSGRHHEDTRRSQLFNKGRLKREYIVCSLQVWTIDVGFSAYSLKQVGHQPEITFNCNFCSLQYKAFGMRQGHNYNSPTIFLPFLVRNSMEQRAKQSGFAMSEHPLGD